MLIDLITSSSPIEYEKSLKFMEDRVQKIIDGTENSCIWFLEHNHVYTAGRTADENDLLSNPQNIPVVHTNRGGKFTYHGPGQRIVYLMLNLKHLYETPDIHKFIESTENWIIKALAQINIKGEKRTDRVGIWVQNSKLEEKKIAAIGIHIKKWVTMHGVAINYSPKMDLFDNIIPCGVENHGITSIKEQNSTCNFSNFDTLLLQEFTNLFGCKIGNVCTENI